MTEYCHPSLLTWVIETEEVCMSRCLFSTPFLLDLLSGMETKTDVEPCAKMKKIKKVQEIFSTSISLNFALTTWLWPPTWQNYFYFVVLSANQEENKTSLSSEGKTNNYNSNKGAKKTTNTNKSTSEQGALFKFMLTYCVHTSFQHYIGVLCSKSSIPQQNIVLCHHIHEGAVSKEATKCSFTLPLLLDRLHDLGKCKLMVGPCTIRKKIERVGRII